MDTSVLIIVDDNEQNRDNLQQYFKGPGAFEECYGFDSLPYLLGASPSLGDCAILICIAENDHQQANNICQLKIKYKNARILILSGQLGSQEVLRLVASGVSGIIDRSASFITIHESLITIMSGGCVVAPAVARVVFDYLQSGRQFMPHLSAREREVLNGITEGLSYKAIGQRLNISINTVRKYIRRLYLFLDVNSRSELMARYHPAALK